MLRALVIGARRHRQGIGEFVARYLAAAGVDVCGVVGTSEASVARAQTTLAESYSVECRGYTDLAMALAAERPDMVAICSPFAAHRAHLEATAAANCHCLCEKPLWWEDGPASRAAETARLVDTFHSRHRLLALVTQWPCTLPEFYRLHPQAHGEPIEKFTMHMGPMSHGKDMVIDAAPHPLSMLQHLLGCGRVSGVESKYLHAERSDLCLDFNYIHAAGTARVNCRFTTTREPPRPAAYSINGRCVDRWIQLPQYELFFVSQGESDAQEHKIKLRDPLETLVADFVRNATAGVLTDRQRLIESVVGLETLLKAVPDAESGSK